MAEQDTDVAAASSAAPETDGTEGTTAPGAVTPEVALPEDRPAQNVMAEMNRKFTRVERQIAELAALMANQPQQVAKPAVPAPAQAGAEYSDDQLAQLAASGNAEAQRLLIERITDRKTQQQQQIATYQSQLADLYRSYPALSDPMHPLTQAAMRTKAHLVQQGHAPQHPYTDVQAILYAVAGNQQLLAGSTPAPEVTRRAAVNAQQGIDGSAPRRPAASGSPKARQFDAKTLEIAKRMGVDPAKAMDNFEKRQSAGRSSVSPLVSSIVREQGGS